MILWIYCFVLGISGIGDHEFHLSKTDVNFNSEEKALQISIHLFIDDLEAALALEDQGQLGICTSKETTEAEAAIKDYLESRFMLMHGPNKLSMDWIGKEVSDDLAGVWCYFEIPNVPEGNEFEIQNTLLLELFDDQRNIVKVSADHKRVSYFLMDGKERNGQFEL